MVDTDLEIAEDLDNLGDDTAEDITEYHSYADSRRVILGIGCSWIRPAHAAQ